MQKMALEACSEYGVTEASRGFGVSRATLNRLRNPKPKQKTERHNHRRLTDAEEQTVLDILTNDRFMDESVPEVYATILDEGTYLCSQRTMYRVLERVYHVRPPSQPNR